MRLFTRRHYTVRRMMAETALFALLLGAAAWGWRAAIRVQDRRRMAEHHTEAARWCLDAERWWTYGEGDIVAYDGLEPVPLTIPGSGKLIYEGLIEQAKRRASYHRRMARKWESGAAHPWLPVAPDPPPPE